MENKYTIYNDEITSGKITPLLNAQQPNTNPILSTSKDTAKNLSLFLLGTKLFATYDNKLEINSINLLQMQVKPGTTTFNMTQKFNPRATYVATVDRSISAGITEFYSQVKTALPPKEPKIVFNAANESNLQQVFHTSFREQPPVTQNVSTSSVENGNVLDFNLAKTVDTSSTMDSQYPMTTNDNYQMDNAETRGKVRTLKRTPNNHFQRIAGNITVVMLGTIAAAVLTFASILIGVKIINM